MKRRNYSLDIFLIGIILSLTCFVIVYISLNGDSKFNSSTASATSIPNIKKDSQFEDNVNIVQSENNGLQMYEESYNNSSSSYSIQYVVTEHKNLDTKINEYIESERETFLSIITDKKKSDSMEKRTLNINVNVYPYKEEYYSIVFKKEELSEGISFNETIKTFFFNNKTGEILSIDSLLNKNVVYLKKLSNYAHKKMMKNNDYKGMIDSKKLTVRSSPTWDNYKHFSIHDDSLEIYFDSGDLGQEINVSTSLVIPLAFINPILAKEYRSKSTSDVTIIASEKRKKQVALTFDDGPHPKYTNQILKTLEKYNAKATFFMLGYQVQEHPTIAKEVLTKGNEIGNHSYSHPQLTKLTLKKVMKEYNTTNKAIYEATGQYPTVFRPPYGDQNEQICDAIPIPVVLWTLDTLDWKEKNSKKLLNNVKSQVKDNSIILMHDIHASTADGLDKVLAYLQKEGYQFVTVSELMENK